MKPRATAALSSPSLKPPFRAAQDDDRCAGRRRDAFQRIAAGSRQSRRIEAQHEACSSPDGPRPPATTRARIGRISVKAGASALLARRRGDAAPVLEPLRAARSPDRRSTDRSQTSGCSAAAPSSLAFSTERIHALVGGHADASVTGEGSSRSTATRASTRTSTALAADAHDLRRPLPPSSRRRAARGLPRAAGAAPGHGAKASAGKVSVAPASEKVRAGRCAARDRQMERDGAETRSDRWRTAPSHRQAQAPLSSAVERLSSLGGRAFALALADLLERRAGRRRAAPRSSTPCRRRASA